MDRQPADVDKNSSDVADVYLAISFAFKPVWSSQDMFMLKENGINIPGIGFTRSNTSTRSFFAAYLTSGEDKIAALKQLRRTLIFFSLFFGPSTEGSGPHSRGENAFGYENFRFAGSHTNSGGRGEQIAFCCGSEGVFYGGWRGEESQRLRNHFLHFSASVHCLHFQQQV